MELERWLHADVIQLDHYDHHSVLRKRAPESSASSPGSPGRSPGNALRRLATHDNGAAAAPIAARTARSRTPTDVACARALARVRSTFRLAWCAHAGRIARALLGTQPRVGT